MAEKVVFTVQLEDDIAVESRFKKNDWRQIKYLVNKTYRRKGEKIMLSILMFPAVWSVESAIWQRDYGLDANVGECGSERERSEWVSRTRNECYETACALVKDALRSQARSVFQYGSDEIELKKHKLVLVNELGYEDLVVEIPKKQWGMLWTACSHDYMNSGHETVVRWVMNSAVWGIEKIVWNRDYANIFESDYALQSSEELTPKIDERVELMKDVFETARERLFHCMD